MKTLLIRMLAIVALAISGNCSDSFAQTNLKRKTDSVALLVQKYLDAKDAAAVYALTGDSFHKSQSPETFKSFAEGQLFPLGMIVNTKPLGLKQKTGRYKFDYSTVSLQMSISLDDANKIRLFLFEPYIAEKAAPVATNNPLKTEFDRKIDSVARTYIQKGVTSGLSIGILQHGNVSTYGYGETAKGNGKVPDANTIFEIASISKTFTATLLAWYANKGMVGLNDPITKYLPDSVVQNTALQGITLMQLSNHTSGLQRMPGNFNRHPGFNNKDPYQNYSVPLMYRYLKNCMLQTPPGEKYDYSNLGVALLGVILENVSGTPFEQMVKEIICQPLHMQSTVQFPDKEQLARQVPAVYDERGNPTPLWAFQGMVAHGALRSTATDLLLYAKANMGAAPAELSKAMQLTHQITYAKGPRIGLGWHNIGIDGTNYFFHNGGTAGSSSYLIWNIKKQLAIVILSNCSLETGDTGRGIAKLVE